MQVPLKWPWTGDAAQPPTMGKLSFKIILNIAARVGAANVSAQRLHACVHHASMVHHRPCRLETFTMRCNRSGPPFRLLASPTFEQIVWLGADESALPWRRIHAPRRKIRIPDRGQTGRKLPQAQHTSQWQRSFSMHICTRLGATMEHYLTM